MTVTTSSQAQAADRARRSFSTLPDDFLPKDGLMDYYQRLIERDGSLPPALAINAPARLKETPEDFLVTEPVQPYPTQAHHQNGNGHHGGKKRYLTLGPQSDLAGLYVDPKSTNCKGVRCTFVKRATAPFYARDLLAQKLSRALHRYIRPEDITSSGLKDRWAVTSQLIHIASVSYNELMRLRLPQPQNGRDWIMVKDAYPSTERLESGRHGYNHFDINVRLPGWSAQQIEEYMAPRLQLLNKFDWWIPNPYGRQRLGRRQNLHTVGRVLVTGDYQAPDNVYQFASSAEAATYKFLFETTNRENPLAEQTRQETRKHWLYFDELKGDLQPVCHRANLGFEYKIAERLADTRRYQGDFQKVLASMPKDSSLWVGAWQSYWWNQALIAMLHQMDNMSESELKRFCMHDLNTGYTRRSIAIPLLMNMDNVKDYYLRLGFDQAIAELDQADDFVRRQYLTPHSHNPRNDNRQPTGPWRKAFIEVSDFEGEAQPECYHCSFNLRSGAYATVFLGMIFNLDDPFDDDSDNNNNS